MKKLLLAIVLGTFVPVCFAQQRYVGGDISMLPKYESAGVVYKDKSGKIVSDVIGFFQQEGQNAMRVRLFVDPSKDNDKPWRSLRCRMM